MARLATVAGVVVMLCGATGWGQGTPRLPTIAQEIVDILVGEVVTRDTTPAAADVLGVGDGEAVRAALADAGTLQVPEAVRYVWIPDGNAEDRALVSFVLNSVVSRSDRNFAPGTAGSPIQFLHGGRLVRVDLLALCPYGDGDDFRSVSETWDRIRNPYFLTDAVGKVETIQRIETVLQVSGKPATIYRDGAAVATVPVGAAPLVIARTVSDGAEWARVEYGGASGWALLSATVKVIERTREQRIDFDARTWLPHVDLVSGSKLQGLTACENPIVWCQSLYQSALSQIDGGLYYEFVGLRPSTTDGVSDYGQFLRRFGLSEAEIETLRADQRGVLSYSRVTGKPRRVDVFDRSARPALMQGLIAVTLDPLDGDRDPRHDPIRNLLTMQPGGTEVIFERNNGHLGFALFDGRGKLVDEAPQTLVADHLIPAPYTRRLQPAISCIRCHGENEADGGWKPFQSDGRPLVSGTVAAVDDLAGPGSGLDLRETAERLQALYGDRLDKAFRRAREDQSDAIVVSTLPARRDGVSWQYGDVSRALADRWTRYSFSPVTPAVAAAELGIVIPDGQTAAVVLAARLGTSTPEDPCLALLMQGTPIVRLQWEAVFADAAARALATRPRRGQNP